jgi:histidinol-phosphate aminotransferase
MFRSGLEKLPVYSMTEEPQWDVKLDANERSAPLPHLVRMALRRRFQMIATHRYPDLGAETLRTLLAEAYQLRAEQITIGNGSSELIEAVCCAFGGAGRSIVYPWPSFSMYPIYAAIADSPAVAAPFDENFQLSVDSVVKTVKQAKAKLLILCNPNNPTGGAMPPKLLRAVLEQVSCPVLVDEAYQEFYGESCIPWLKEFPQLLVARTFSKAYGLAACRIGYLLASPALTAAVGKRLLPYHVNAFSLAAAEVCFAQREFILQDTQRTIRRREKIRKQLAKMSAIEVFPSATNFLLVRVQDPAALDGELVKRGIGVRNFSHVPELKGCLRVTIGNKNEMDSFCETVATYNAVWVQKEKEQHGK